VLALIAGAIGSIPLVPIADRWRRELQAGASAMGVDLAAVVLLALILTASVIQCAAGSYNPFIYFRF
jgi:hypothetical protein